MDRSLVWKNYFQEIYGKDYSYYTYKIDFKYLYRGRLFSDNTLSEVENEMDSVKKIWSLSKKRIKKQRCNLKGEPMLYVSSIEEVVPYEVRAKEGDYLCMIKYKQLDSFEPLSIIGWNDLMNFRIKDIIKNHYKGKSKTIKIIDEKISKIFKSFRLNDNSFDIYDLTIGLSKLFFEKGSKGIVYPSVASSYRGYNVAVNPTYAKNKLEPLSINIYKVINDNNKLRNISEGVILENGEIKWERVNK